MKKRSLTQIKPAIPATDGEGVKIWRNVAHGAMQTHDPFLMQDEICSDIEEAIRDYRNGTLV